MLGKLCPRGILPSITKSPVSASFCYKQEPRAGISLQIVSLPSIVL